MILLCVFKGCNQTNYAVSLNPPVKEIKKNKNSLNKTFVIVISTWFYKRNYSGRNPAVKSSDVAASLGGACMPLETAWGLIVYGTSQKEIDSQAAYQFPS